MTITKTENMELVEAIRTKYTTQITGRDYLRVAGRIALFRLDYPVHGERRGAILTECIAMDDTRVTFRASVSVDGVTLSTGYASLLLAEGKNVKGRVVEMCETNAIGRALGLAGYGTEEFDLDDEQEIADSPVERRKKTAEKNSPAYVRRLTWIDSWTSGTKDPAHKLTIKDLSEALKDMGKPPWSDPKAPVERECDAAVRDWLATR